MTLAVLGIDALDPDLVDPADHPNLTLTAHRSIETIVSSKGEPSTHELWPTIITGLPPTEHGLQLDDGVAWSNPVVGVGSKVSRFILPSTVRTRIGAWLLNNTQEDTFRVPATYYRDRGIDTVFDDRAAMAIGVPNYVTEPDHEDREHQLRRSLGDLFERDPDAIGGHRTSDADQFYEQCLEMAMVRFARVRRAVRSRGYELVFSYTGGLDLIGHIAHDRPGMIEAAYAEFNDIVGDVVADLDEDDELLLVSDHGLQEGVHTHEAMVASTIPRLVENVTSVTEIRSAIETELETGVHDPAGRSFERTDDAVSTTAVQDQLEDLGYL